MNKSLLNWFHSTLGVNRINGIEVQTTCPKCHHDRFYFNTNKKIGWCHRASCHWKPSLKDLIDIVGYGPDDKGYYPQYRKVTQEIPINLPEQSYPLIVNDKMTWKEGVDYLLNRNIPINLIKRFNIYGDGKNVIVPVMKNGVLVSYVQRSISTKHYHYPYGGRHQTTFLGWDEAQYWDQITLVENTFVSLALRHLQVTTNFGSHLTNEQVLTLARSSAKLVVLLWDEGAKTSKPLKLLKKFGVPCKAVSMKGQPDDYSVEEIKSRIYSE